MKLKLPIAALLACFVLISGCVWMQDRSNGCTPPYVNTGNRCCLDQNYNSVCDEDEIQHIENVSNETNNSGNLTNTTQCPMPGEFVEFYGQGCHFCANMVPVLSQVENETGVHFRILEIWYNQTNREFLNKYETYIRRDCGSLGVPTFINIRTNKSVCGQMSVEELGQFIIENSHCE